VEMPVATRVPPADVDEEAAVDELGDRHRRGLRGFPSLARLAAAAVENDRGDRRVDLGGIRHVVEEDSRRLVAPPTAALDRDGEDVAEDLHAAGVVAVRHPDHALETPRP